MSIELHPSSLVTNVGASLRGTVVFINTDVMDVVKMKTALKMKKRNEWFTSTVALLSLILFQFWVQNTYSDRGVVQYADDSTGHAASKSWDKTEEALSKMATNLEHY